MAETALVAALVLLEKPMNFKGIKRGNNTIQHFDYTCHRTRDIEGQPYGPTVSSLVTFTIRNVSVTDSKTIYGYLKDETSHDFTFMFNATFGTDSKEYISHESAMIVTGYVVDIEEFFEASTTSVSEDQQMLMQVKLLINAISYMGEATDTKTPPLTMQ